MTRSGQRDAAPVKVRVWGRANSTNVKKVLWCALECGIEVDRIDAGGVFGGLETADFEAMNPYRQIPVLQDGPLTLRESNAIVRYLCAAYGDGLFEADPGSRASADAWMDWSSFALMPHVMTLIYGLVRTPPDQRDQGAIAEARAELERLLGPVDQHLAQAPYLSGSRFGMADFPLGCLVYALIKLGVGVGHPALRAWYEDRLLSRAAYVAAVAIPLT